MIIFANPDLHFHFIFLQFNLCRASLTGRGSVVQVSQAALVNLVCLEGKARRASRVWMGGVDRRENVARLERVDPKEFLEMTDDRVFPASAVHRSVMYKLCINSINSNLDMNR